MSAPRIHVRLRPSQEKEVGNDTLISLDADGKTVVLNGDATAEGKVFRFDGHFGQDSTQQSVFEGAGKPIVERVLEGFCGTLLCYGQTGTGKSHTMCNSAPGEEGLVQRCTHYLFKRVKELASETHQTATITVSFVQLYKKEVQDLLNNCTVCEFGLERKDAKRTVLKGAVCLPVVSPNEVLQRFEEGCGRRVVKRTKMNDQSSRGHVVLLLNVNLVGKDGAAAKSTLTFVDLAGYENFEKTGVRDDPGLAEECKSINSSLFSLGTVAHKLATGASHIPWRESNLAQIMSDKMGGKNLTTFVLTVGPCKEYRHETLNTLDFGTTCKAIKVEATKNVKKDPKVYIDMLEKENAALKDKCARLTAELETRRGAPTTASSFISTADSDTSSTDGGEVQAAETPTTTSTQPPPPIAGSVLSPVTSQWSAPGEVSEELVRKIQIFESQIEDYETQVKELNQQMNTKEELHALEIERIAGELQTLELRAREAEDAMESMRASTAQVHSDANGTRQKFEEAQRNTETWQSNAQETQMALEAALDECRTLEEDRRAKSDCVAELEEQIRLLQEARAQGEEMIAALEAAREASNERVRVLEQEHSISAAKCAQLETEKTQLNDRCAQLEKEKTEHNERCVLLESERTQLKEIITQTEAEKEAAQHRITTLEAQLQSLASEGTALKEMLESEKKEKMEQHARLLERLESMESIHKSEQNSITDGMRQLRTGIEQRQEALQASLQQKQEAIQTLLDQKETQEQQHTQIASDLRSKLRARETELSEHMEKLAVAELGREEAAKREVSMKHELAARRAEVEEIARRARMELEEATQRADHAELRAAEAERRATLAGGGAGSVDTPALRVQHEGLQRECEALREDLARERQRVDEITKRLREAEAARIAAMTASPTAASGTGISEVASKQIAERDREITYLRQLNDEKAERIRLLEGLATPLSSNATPTVSNTPPRSPSPPMVMQSPSLASLGPPGGKPEGKSEGGGLFSKITASGGLKAFFTELTVDKHLRDSASPQAGPAPGAKKAGLTHSSSFMGRRGSEAPQPPTE